MLRYKPPAYRPHGAGASPRKALGQARMTERVLVTTAGATVVFAGLSTWVGIRTGLNETGLVSAAGWIVAAGSGLYAGFMIAQIIGALAKGGSAVPATPFSR